MKPPAIVLCAGESRRMGSPKALLPFRDGTFLSVLAESLAVYCAPVYAVFGADGERLADAAPAGVVPVINPDYRFGMLTSLQAGLRAAEPLERVLFTLVDHPAPSSETLEAVLHSRAPIAIPRMNGKRGHPVVIASNIVQEFLREPAASKVRDVIDRHAAEIEYLGVKDPGIHDDVDDPARYQEFLARDAARG